MSLGALISESRNPATMELDKLSTLAMLTCINDEAVKYQMRFVWSYRRLLKRWI